MVTFYSHIVNFILTLRLELSKPQFNHLVTFIQGIILTDGRINVSQIRRSTHELRDLSSMTRFLNESPFSSSRMNHQRIKFIHDQIKNSHSDDSRPVVFLIIDDSQCKKDRSTSKMEGLDNHFSHSDGKSIWSHCLVTAHVVCENMSFAYSFRSYFRKEYCCQNNRVFKSKNDLAIELIQAYTAHSDEQEQVYVMVDSWYTSQKLVDACAKNGFHLIGALKTNRIIYPKGIGVQISEFASNFIKNSDLRSVTADGREYKVYTYEGNLKDSENAKVLLSWEKVFDSNKTPFCLLCTDSELDLVTILRYYAVRWNIETGYRYFKELLGFDQYQLLSMKGIERFWCVEFLVYNFLEYQRLRWASDCIPLSIGDVVRKIRKDLLGQLVVYAYEQALHRKPLMTLLKELRLSAY